MIRLTNVDIIFNKTADDVDEKHERKESKFNFKNWQKGPKAKSRMSTTRSHSASHSHSAIVPGAGVEPACQ